MTNRNPFTPEMKECPYPGYDEWREDSPLVWSDEVQAWLVTGFDEAKAVLTDHQTFSSKNSVFGGPQVEHPEFPSMINMDEPEHKKLRALVAQAFTPRMIEEAWEPRIREYVAELLDAVEARGNGELEVVGDLAFPLPVQMIAEIIGVPPQMFEQFKVWSNRIAQGIGRIPEHGYASFEEAAEAAEAAIAEEEKREYTAEEVARFNETGVQRGAGEVAEDEEVEASPEDSLFLYFLQQVQERKAAPRDDLMTRLVEATVDGEQLTDVELVAFLVLLLVAGNETTTNLINHATRGLTEHPEQQQRLRDRPELMGAVLEEALRWEAPIQGFYRRANQDVTLAGADVRAGQALLVMYGAANRDPAKYECPADFDVERFDVSSGSRDHLAFGHGIHTCLGANLARIEAGVAIEGLLQRFDWLTAIEDQNVAWFDTPFFRGPTAYRVRIDEPAPGA
ncbi:MAG: cytochrome P450 [Dehalococcoidia bacterium]|jgi:cytochrome P450|nr:cytochrome P450 [Dehalococcoidia bacterium]